MNFIVAILLFSGAAAAGWPTVTQSEVYVVEVVGDSQAAITGLHAGDIVKSYAGEPIDDTDRLKQLIRGGVNHPASMVVTRPEPT